MSEWPRCYFLDEDLQWLLVVRPEGSEYHFAVARDGWLLLEAQCEIGAGVSYDAFIRQFLLDLRTERFHQRFHEVAKSYAPSMPTHQDCPGSCPWTVSRECLWEACFEEWAWRVTPELRRAGCRVFMHDDALMPQGARA